MSARYRTCAILSLIFLFVVGNVATVASADPKDQKPRKPSSFAPHHTVYGAPIQRPILHKRHKASHNAPKSAATQLPDSGVH